MPFGERHRAQLEDQLYQVADDVALAFAGQMNVVHQAHVELDEMGRRLAEFAQASLAGTEIVVGEAHADVAQARSKLDETSALGHRGFVDLDHQIQSRHPSPQIGERGKELLR
jgi:hypothetical protein